MRERIFIVRRAYQIIHETLYTCEIISELINDVYLFIYLLKTNVVEECMYFASRVYLLNWNT